MRRSTERILTTHAGSLPRPENLTSLFVRRARGEGVDADEIAAAGRDAVRAIVPKQAEAGIDVGNNGEQQRDSFFLYLKERLTGLGGTWQRPSRADVDRYPEFKKRWLEQTSSKARVSPNEGLPMAIGEVRYIDPAAIEAECRDFADVLKANPDVFVEAVHECSVARHCRRRDQEPALRHRLEISRRRSARRCGSNMKPSFAQASCCRSTRPTSRSSGTFHSRTSRCRSSSSSSKMSSP